MRVSAGVVVVLTCKIARGLNGHHGHFLSVTFAR